MNIVVDTNIVFSTFLNPHSTIGELLMNVKDDINFYAPELLKSELQRYETKIATYSRLSQQALQEIESTVFTIINFIPEERISEKSWIKAYELTANIDEDDTPFVALTIELNAMLWSGDKILMKGLINRGNDMIITTAQLKKILH